MGFMNFMVNHSSRLSGLVGTEGFEPPTFSV